MAAKKLTPTQTAEFARIVKFGDLQKVYLRGEHKWLMHDFGVAVNKRVGDALEAMGYIEPDPTRKPANFQEHGVGTFVCHPYRAAMLISNPRRRTVRRRR